MRAPEFLGLLQNVKRVGPGLYMATCPGHEDSTPSLSIKEAEDRILLHDFGGCSVEHVVASVCRTMADLYFDNRRTGGHNDPGAGSALANSEAGGVSRAPVALERDEEDEPGADDADDLPLDLEVGDPWAGTTQDAATGKDDPDVEGGLAGGLDESEARDAPRADSIDEILFSDHPAGANEETPPISTPGWTVSSPPPFGLRHRRLGKPTNINEIRDVEGRLFGCHPRWDFPGGGKEMRWWRNDRWRLGDVEVSQAPLYGSERLAALAPGSRVILVEGEKTADRLSEAGHFAVASVTGASSTPCSAVLEVLRGFEVVFWPDADEEGKQHMDRIADALRDFARSRWWVDPRPGAPAGEDAADLTADQIEKRLEGMWGFAKEVGVNAAAQQTGSCWAAARSAPDFLNEADPEIEFLYPKLLVRGCLTELYSPRGLGKSQMVLAVAVRLAAQGRRVLLVDRDNPPRIIRQRLRAWAAEEAPHLKVITRQHAPPLTKPELWKTFPVGAYDLVIIDSLDASAEGIGEQSSEAPSKAIAVVLDIIRCDDGPAVLIVGNTVKSGAHSRGSGVIEDRADIVFEARDATDLKPTGQKPWVEELPPADTGSWGQRTGRRQERECYRLALTCTKFRLGPEPAPFIVELDFSKEPWMLRDVTDEVDQAGAEARATRQRDKEEQLESAAAALAAQVRCRAAAGSPLQKDDAEQLLRGRGLTQKAARAVINKGTGTSWCLEDLAGRRGRPIVLLPVDGTAVSGTATTEIMALANPSSTVTCERGISVAPVEPAPRKSGPRKPLKDQGLKERGISVVERFDSRHEVTPAANSDDSLTAAGMATSNDVVVNQPAACVTPEAASDSGTCRDVEVADDGSTGQSLNLPSAQVTPSGVTLLAARTESIDEVDVASPIWRDKIHRYLSNTTEPRTEAQIIRWIGPSKEASTLRALEGLVADGDVEKLAGPIGGPTSYRLRRADDDQIIVTVTPRRAGGGSHGPVEADEANDPDRLDTP